MPRLTKRWYLRRFSPILFGIILAVGVTNYIEKRFVTSFKGHVEDANLSARSSIDSRDSETSGTLYLDSIFSIVQSYYVDRDRVMPRDLIIGSLKELGEKHKIDWRMPTEERILLEKDGTKLSLALPNRVSYTDLLGTAMSISKFLSETDSKNPGKSLQQGVHQFANVLLSSLDPHSALLNEDEYADLRQGTEGEFGGLGVIVGVRDNLLTVIEPILSSPAYRAGIKSWDRIMGINGIATFGTPLNKLVDHMRGSPGSKVHLEVLRDGASAPRDFHLTREIVNVNPVTSKVISVGGSQIGIFKIESFSSKTTKELLTALLTFKKNAGSGVGGVVLDLRENPGGLLDQAIQVADLFLKNGVIVSTRGRRREVEHADSGFYDHGYPIVVLINGDSASASEIVAGALQDHGRAVVIGEPSFGKGSVQTIFELPQSSALKLTVARYYTPTGRSIQQKGIVPDIEIHPVTMAKTNENLLGHYRYKSEKYLAHSLIDNRVSPSIGMLPEGLKGYYLSDPKEVSQVDHDLEIAKLIVAKVNATHKLPLSEENLRSSYWIGLAKKEIQEYLELHDRRVSDYLASEHKVSWEGSPPTNLAEVLFNVNTIPGALLPAGGQMTLSYNIDNRTPNPLGRVSVFVRSSEMLENTTEKLVGKVNPGSDLKGEISFRVNPGMSNGNHRYVIGLAVDGKPIESKSIIQRVNVFPSREPSLDARANFRETSGSQTDDGIVEANESGDLEIELKNSDSTTLTDLSVKLLNFSGTQVSITGDDVLVPYVNPGEAVKINATLTSSSSLRSTKLGFGIIVTGKSLVKPLLKYVSVTGRPRKHEFSRSH